jgi:poly-gamma-glutamate synthesis protein (capsule biosynthesis protein)
VLVHGALRVAGYPRGDSAPRCRAGRLGLTPLKHVVVMKIFLCGDVMTGRGIDQVLPNPSLPQLHEDYVRSATQYVRLAERANGPIPAPVAPSYIWGAALDELDAFKPDARVVNLETAITRSEDYAPKGINYRMSPQNAACLTAAGIDCCVLANNHVLDWGRAGLRDTLENLARLEIKTAGAGRNIAEARAPALLSAKGKGRLVVLSYATASSGVPSGWAASAEAPGINFLGNLSEASVADIAAQIARVKKPGDDVVVSIHWGSNWGYKISASERRFAHALIDEAGASIVHGHSSHHPKAIEIYKERLILYGCGDFLNDYEGIEGYEAYRDDLVLMYFATCDHKSGRLEALELVPLQIRRFQLTRPSREDTEWLLKRLNREYRPFGAGISVTAEGRFALSLT